MVGRKKRKARKSGVYIFAGIHDFDGKSKMNIIHDRGGKPILYAIEYVC